MNKPHTFALFASIPHSGIAIPPETYWLKDLSPSVLMCDVDAFVDDLYKPTLEYFDIPSVIFKWHRYSIDANRFSTDISLKTVEMPKDKLSQSAQESPSDIHWHKTTKGYVLISKPLSETLHKELIEKYFNPFHQKIKKLISNFKKQGNTSIYFLDLHSMPSKGLNFHKDKGEIRKQVVISNNHGQSCSKTFTELVVKAYKIAGFEVGLNWPYVGGAITQHYGNPKTGLHGLQIELNRGLYMDEETKHKTSRYTHIQKQLKQAIAYIIKHQKTLSKSQE